MQEKFVEPQTQEEFIKKASDVTPIGAKSVIQGLKNVLKKKVGPIEAEIKFFEEVVVYKETGQLPERYKK